MAQAILNKLQMGEAAKVAVAQPVPAAPEPQLTLPLDLPEPTPAPAPKAVHTGGGDLYQSMDELRNQIQKITESLAALSNSFLGGGKP